MTRDADFVGLFGESLILETIETPEIAYLLGKAKEHFEKYRETLPRDVLLMELEAEPEGSRLDGEVILAFYDQAPEPSAAMLNYLYDHARGWFQPRAFQAAMDHAAIMLDEGRIGDARDLLGRMSLEVGGIGDRDYGTSLRDDAQEFFDVLLRT